AAWIWLEKEPPRSILIWEDLVFKFVNHFFPPSKATNLKNDITNLQQRFDESFGKAWDRFKDLLPAGGNLLNRTPRDELTIIENKSKVRILRNKPIVSKVSTATSSPDVIAFTEIVKELVLMNKATQKAIVKAIEETCVTCGGPHPYYECLAIGGNTFDACAAVRTYNQGGNGYRPQGDSNYRASNQMGPSGFPHLNVQNSQNYNQNRYNQNQGNYQASNNQGFNQQKGKNFNQGNNNYQAPNNQAQVGALIDFLNYMKNNDVNMRAMQNQIGSGTRTEGDKGQGANYKFKMYRTCLSSGSPNSDSGTRKLEECLALADLGASINLMPLSIWKNLSLPELTPTHMTLKLANRSIAYPIGVAEDESVSQIDVIDVASEEYAQEVLGFLDSLMSGNPTPLDPIITSSSPSFTPFEGSEFILEEIETFLRTPDELSNLDDDYYDMEGDILYLEKLLNEDPSLNLPSMKNEDLKQVDVTMTKPSIEEPPELELKDLPSHLKYAYLKGTDKLHVIISKELKDDEKATLLKVLKSHKRAIAGKISNIKGIDPLFCTHEILMEDDFKPAVQHQRRVNPKFYKVIKKEVIKLHDAGLIYHISDILWVSLVHCVPKKGEITVFENEDNELIPTRLVTGWRVCIDYQKLNDSTRKDHFPLLFMDQMLKRLAGNEYYYFLNGF
nr:DNA-directed DNA polymerase [Tanacetum cinerariifolium]